MDAPQIDTVAIGRLARLDVAPAEAEHFRKQLPGILSYVSQLQAVEIVDVTVTVPSVIALRPDGAEQSKVVERILAEAPERSGNFWKVPAVL